MHRSAAQRLRNELLPPEAQPGEASEAVDPQHHPAFLPHTMSIRMVWLPMGANVTKVILSRSCLFKIKCLLGYFR